MQLPDCGDCSEAAAAQAVCLAEAKRSDFPYLWKQQRMFSTAMKTDHAISTAQLIEQASDSHVLLEPPDLALAAIAHLCSGYLRVGASTQPPVLTRAYKHSNRRSHTCVRWSYASMGTSSELICLPSALE